MLVTEVIQHSNIIAEILEIKTIFRISNVQIEEGLAISLGAQSYHSTETAIMKPLLSGIDIVDSIEGRHSFVERFKNLFSSIMGQVAIKMIVGAQIKALLSDEDKHRGDHVV
jgi:hypothetical protein